MLFHEFAEHDSQIIEPFNNDNYGDDEKAGTCNQQAQHPKPLPEVHNGSLKIFPPKGDSEHVPWELNNASREKIFVSQSVIFKAQVLPKI